MTNMLRIPILSRSFRIYNHDKIKINWIFQFCSKAWHMVSIQKTNPQSRDRLGFRESECKLFGDSTRHRCCDLTQEPHHARSIIL